jgi:hypothetical protein
MKLTAAFVKEQSMNRFGMGLLFGAAGALASLAGAWADDTPSPPRTCVIMRSIHRWTDLDDKTALIESASRRYKITFWGSCHEMSLSIFARVERSPSAGLCLERGDVLVFNEGLPSPIGPARERAHPAFEERCIIDSIEALPDKPEAADQPTSH